MCKKLLGISDETFFRFLIKHFFVAIENFHKSKRLSEKSSYYDNADFFFRQIDANKYK